MTIRRITYTLTALYDNEVISDADVLAMTAAEILEATDTGDMIGGFANALRPGVTDVEDVESALHALGNDGTFFESD